MKNTSFHFAIPSVGEGRLSLAHAEIQATNGYTFLSRNYPKVPPTQKVVHLFLNLNSATQEADLHSFDQLLLHIIQVNGQLYWDHTNFITHLYDTLTEAEMSLLSKHILMETKQEILQLSPESASIFSLLEKNIPIN